MTNKVKSRLDAIALALGGISLAGAFGVLPYGALPMVTNDHIHAAWVKKLRADSLAECPEIAPDCARGAWVT